MNVKLTLQNNEEIKEVIERAENAIKELKSCMWDLSKVQLEVTVGDENK